jgi:hypothetical protein
VSGCGGIESILESLTDSQHRLTPLALCRSPRETRLKERPTLRGIRYKVTSTAKLFVLHEEDIDTIMASLSLGTRRLIKRAWEVERPPM